MTTVTVDGREIFTLERRFVKGQEYSEVKISKSVKLETPPITHPQWLIQQLRILEKKTS